MIFQTQPVRWTYVPRLRSREGEGGATGSNRRTLYRTPSLSIVVCLSSQSTLAIYSFWFLHTISYYYYLWKCHNCLTGILVHSYLCYLVWWQIQHDSKSLRIGRSFDLAGSGSNTLILVNTKHIFIPSPYWLSCTYVYFITHTIIFICHLVELRWFFVTSLSLCSLSSFSH